MYLGIDPGVTGAFALMEKDQTIPYRSNFDDIQTCIHTLRDYQTSYGIELAAIEDVHSSPQMGVKSSFTFGKNYGEWLGALHALAIPHVLVTPRKWQKALFDKESTDSIAFCGRNFPQIAWKKNHNITDAVCLALYAKKWVEGLLHGEKS